MNQSSRTEGERSQKKSHPHKGHAPVRHNEQPEESCCEVIENIGESVQGESETYACILEEETSQEAGESAKKRTFFLREYSIRPLEVIGMLVIFVGLVSIFFRFNPTPRPWLAKMTGKKNTAAGAVSAITAQTSNATAPASSPALDRTLEQSIIPAQGIELPIVWRSIGKNMVDEGVIDFQKLESLYAQRGGLTEDVRTLLTGDVLSPIRMTSENAGELLNLLWAFGLGNKNAILERGPMSDPQYGGAGGFASTGGWTLASGDSMKHYSKHVFVSLTANQQRRVENVSKGIYRPCCNNSTYFPDCNHGMAMLGLLELMAVQNVSEKDMYKIALAVNSYWFPDTYLTLGKFFKEKNVEWSSLDPKDLLGEAYSSSSGFQQIQQTTSPIQRRGGSGCGA